MKNQKITEKEWELITALRNFRNAKYFSEWQLELHINALVEELKEEDTSKSSPLLLREWRKKTQICSPKHSTH